MKLECPYPPNVTNNTGDALDPGMGSVFLIRLFDELRRRMGENFERFTFVVHQWAFGQFAGARIPLDPGGPSRVLIVLGDEKEVFPVEEFSSYRAIFRAYGNPAGGASRVHPFPVGYLDAAGEAVPLPFNDRTHSVFFSSYLNRNRVDLYKQFRPIW